MAIEWQPFYLDRQNLDSLRSRYVQASAGVNPRVVSGPDHRAEDMVSQCIFLSCGLTMFSKQLGQMP
jgi:hypothetical protein